MPGGALGIAARPGMSGGAVGMPAVMNVRVRRLRTLTLMRWVKRSRIAGSTGRSRSTSLRRPVPD
jgi:hypothetical protein